MRRRQVGAGFFGVRLGYGAGGLALDIEDSPEELRGEPPAVTDEAPGETVGGPVTYGDNDGPPAAPDIDNSFPYHEGSRVAAEGDGDPDLSHLLAPAGETGTIGPERSGKAKDDGVVRYISPQGSYRYVYFMGGRPVSGLQIMKYPGENRWVGVVAQVWTDPEYRRQGLAMALMERAQKDFDEIRPSKDLSTSGSSWQSAWQSKFPKKARFRRVGAHSWVAPDGSEVPAKYGHQRWMAEEGPTAAGMPPEVAEAARGASGSAGAYGWMGQQGWMRLTTGYGQAALNVSHIGSDNLPRIKAVLQRAFKGGADKNLYVAPMDDVMGGSGEGAVRVPVTPTGRLDFSALDQAAKGGGGPRTAAAGLTTFDLLPVGAKFIRTSGGGKSVCIKVAPNAFETADGRRFAVDNPRAPVVKLAGDGDGDGDGFEQEGERGFDLRDLADGVGETALTDAKSWDQGSDAYGDVNTDEGGGNSLHMGRTAGGFPAALSLATGLAMSPLDEAGWGGGGQTPHEQLEDASRMSLPELPQVRPAAPKHRSPAEARGEANAQRYASQVEAAALQAGLDPAILDAVIWTESRYDTAAMSGAGAQGLMQLTPITQRELGVKNPFAADESITAGAKYLRRLLDKFKSLDLAVAAYNAGPANVIKYSGVPPFPETEAYVAKVKARLARSPFSGGQSRAGQLRRIGAGELLEQVLDEAAGRDLGLRHQYETIIRQLIREGVDDEDIDVALLQQRRRRDRFIQSIHRYKGAKLVGDVDGYYVMRIDNFTASTRLGSKNWCIVRNKKDFENYTSFNKVKFFFYVNAEQGLPAEYAVAVHPSGLEEVYNKDDKLDPAFDKDLTPAIQSLDPEAQAKMQQMQQLKRQIASAPPEQAVQIIKSQNGYKENKQAFFAALKNPAFPKIWDIIRGRGGGDVRAYTDQVGHIVHQFPAQVAYMYGLDPKETAAWAKDGANIATIQRAAGMKLPHATFKQWKAVGLGDLDNVGDAISRRLTPQVFAAWADVFKKGGRIYEIARASQNGFTPEMSLKWLRKGGKLEQLAGLTPERATDWLKARFKIGEWPAFIGDRRQAAEWLKLGVTDDQYRKIAGYGITAADYAPYKDIVRPQDMPSLQEMGRRGFDVSPQALAPWAAYIGAPWITGPEGTETSKPLLTGDLLERIQRLEAQGYTLDEVREWGKHLTTTGLLAQPGKMPMTPNEWADWKARGFELDLAKALHLGGLTPQEADEAANRDGLTMQQLRDYAAYRKGHPGEQVGAAEWVQQHAYSQNTELIDKARAAVRDPNDAAWLLIQTAEAISTARPLPVDVVLKEYLRLASPEQFAAIYKALEGDQDVSDYVERRVLSDVNMKRLDREYAYAIGLWRRPEPAAPQAPTAPAPGATPPVAPAAPAPADQGWQDVSREDVERELGPEVDERVAGWRDWAGPAALGLGLSMAPGPGVAGGGAAPAPAPAAPATQSTTQSCSGNACQLELGGGGKADAYEKGLNAVPGQRGQDVYPGQPDLARAFDQGAEDRGGGRLAALTPEQLAAYEREWQEGRSDEVTLREVEDNLRFQGPQPDLEKIQKQLRQRMMLDEPEVDPDPDASDDSLFRLMVGDEYADQVNEGIRERRRQQLERLEQWRAKQPRVAAAVDADLQDAVQYIVGTFDMDPDALAETAGLDDLSLVNEGEMDATEVPVLSEGHLEDRDEPYIRQQFEAGHVPPVVILEGVVDGRPFETLADGHGRVAYARAHGLSVPFARYRFNQPLTSMSARSARTAQQQSPDGQRTAPWVALGEVRTQDANLASHSLSRAAYASSDGFPGRTAAAHPNTSRDVPVGAPRTRTASASHIQAVTYSEVRDVHLRGDVVERSAAFVEAHGGGYVPARTRLELEAFFAQHSVNASDVDAEVPSDGVRRPAISVKLAGLGARPPVPLVPVGRYVRAPGGQLEVLQRVIEPIAVDVMNDLSGFESPPEMTLHHQAVLVDSASVYGEDLVGPGTLAHDCAGSALTHAAQVTRRSPGVNRQPWVCCDLDNTLLEDVGPGGAERGLLGAPKPGAAEAMKELLSLGWRVTVYTARLTGYSDQVAQALAGQIASWLTQQGIPFTDVWYGPKPKADYFVDDKAVPFRGSWNDVLQELTNGPAPDDAGDEGEDVVDEGLSTEFEQMGSFERAAVTIDPDMQWYAAALEIAKPTMDAAWKQDALAWRNGDRGGALPQCLSRVLSAVGDDLRINVGWAAADYEGSPATPLVPKASMSSSQVDGRITVQVGILISHKLILNGPKFWPGLRDQLITQLVDVLQHELAHDEQHRRREYRPREHRDVYLAAPHEIEAYALNIVSELQRGGPVDPRSSAALETSPTYWRFLGAFGPSARNPNPAALNRLKKTVFEILRDRGQGFEQDGGALIDGLDGDPNDFDRWDGMGTRQDRSFGHPTDKRLEQVVY